MNLREQFEKKTGNDWCYKDGEPTVEYAEWLEALCQSQADEIRTLNVNGSVDLLRDYRILTDNLKAKHDALEQRIKESEVLTMTRVGASGIAPKQPHDEDIDDVEVHLVEVGGLDE
jgi:hypothetical protein